ncbi:hypothetical protein HF685_06835 [Parasphingorhabdus halotolerans]|uniref:Uncharacterized protein n=1 Tax=Parasphingorhabdus halotolerans TaxID=2725558 RepID=A0A6H2DQP4_9SPHN|nr:hypothetical protein HF685_06835 [Parasphingorhabdus halotolerans]
MQRLQVGVIGLVTVLLLVSIANFVLQRASDEPTALEEIQAGTANSARELADGIDEKPAEPLAEIGITPAPMPEDDVIQPVVKPKVESQIVPDLKPDPKLEAPMDRESR